MLEVLLTGTYSARNKGDAAMQIGCALELQRQLGSVRVTIACPFPEMDRDVYEPYGIEVVASHRRKLGRCLLQMSLGRGGLSVASWARSPDAAAIRRSDLVIDLSGDAITEDYGPHVVLSHLYPIWLAVKLERPIVLASQTIGPFRWLGPVVRRILARVDGIAARDEFTEQILRDLAIRGPLVVRTADLAHLLPPAPKSHATELLSRAPEGFAKRPILTVTVSRLLGHRRSLGSGGRAKQFVGTLAHVLNAMLDRHDLSVLLVAHSTGPRPARDDRSISRELAAQLHPAERTHFLEDDLPPAVAKGLLGLSSLVCATRLHSAIGALSQGVPTVVLGYGPKARGLMDGWQQTERTLPVEDLETTKLFQTLESTWLERESIRASLERLREDRMDQARANIGLASRILANRQV